MSLRILHISPYYLPDEVFGGPVFSVSSLCEAMVAQGHEVTVFTVGYLPQRQYPFEEIINGVRVVYHQGNAGKPCQVSLQLWQALKQQVTQYQLVHAHTWWNILIFRAIQIIKRKGVPMVLSPRGMLGDYSFAHNKTRLKHWFQQSAGRRLLEGITLHGTSMAEAAEIHRRSGTPLQHIEVVPNLLGRQLQGRYHEPGQGYVLGLLSRLHHKKGIELLLEAVAQCPQVDALLLGG
ncbi:MAG TPA: glycosyltransferase, partial [Phnomibacter sp.]|nr:glycosyltransferase [Phnomibacter sp.]